MFLLSLFVQLFQQSHLFPICVVLTYNDSRIFLARLAKSQGIVSVNDFWFPRRLQELLKAPLCFLRSFCFARIRLDPLCCQVLYHHGISMIVSRFNFFTENFVLRCDQITKMFRSGHDCSARLLQETLVLFSCSSRYHNLARSESAYLHCAYPNPVPLLLAAPLEVHVMSWKCLEFLALGFPKALLKYFHQTNSFCIPVANQAIHAIYLCTSSRSPF